MNVEVTFDDSDDAKEGISILISAFYYFVFLTIFNQSFRQKFDGRLVKWALHLLHRLANSNGKMWGPAMGRNSIQDVITLPLEMRFPGLDMWGHSNVWVWSNHILAVGGIGHSHRQFISQEIFEAHVQPNLMSFDSAISRMVLLQWQAQISMMMSPEVPITVQ